VCTLNLKPISADIRKKGFALSSKALREAYFHQHRNGHRSDTSGMG